MWFIPVRRLPNLLRLKLLRGYKTKPTRVRFAPSPTGQLHLGGLRTALYNYLFARARGGAFILRVEDTDAARSVPGAAAALERDLRWAGLRPDEGPTEGGPCAPYVQSERLELYQQHAERLVSAGAAYRCFCSARRLDALRRDAARAGRPPRYDNRCRALGPQHVRDNMRKGTPYCIRFKLTPDCRSFVDLVYGPVTHDVSRAEGDPVLVKADGRPTYHLASVVDDRAMGVSHVLRGLEWQISTTKHLQLYKAFGWEPPLFGHLPLIVNADGSKLSKRQQGATVADYRDQGVLPGALVQFLALAGGGFPHAPGAPLAALAALAARDLHQLAREVYRDDVPLTWVTAVQFQIELVSPHPTRLNPDLLDDCGRLELQRLAADPRLCGELVERLQELVRERHGDRGEVTGARLRAVLSWAAQRVSRLNQLVEPEFEFLWVAPETPSSPEDVDAELLTATVEELNRVEWEGEALQRTVKGVCKDRGVKWGVGARSLRVALCGRHQGPPVHEMLTLLGREEALRRVNRYIQGGADTVEPAVEAKPTCSS